MSINLPAPQPAIIMDDNNNNNPAMTPEESHDLPDLVCDECGHVVGWDNWCPCHDD